VATETETLKEAGIYPRDRIFNPKSIAVMGVTQTPGTVPYDIFHNILASGYKGVLYPIAPGKRSIMAVPAYRYLTDVDDEVDLVVIVFPAGVCARALEMCGRKGVKAAIVISAGFREVGPAGVKLEQRIKDICRQYGISLIGPNCLGVINTDPQTMLNASFARKMPAEGRIAFLSQSGALCTAVLDYARGRNIGFSKFVSFGNKAGVTEIGLLDYLHQDPATDVILLYLEELRDGRSLIDTAKRITRGDNPKPILAIKSGRTPQGADAASSHTGSLAGEDEICQAVFRESGIIRCNTLEEMFNTAIMLTHQPLPKGNKLAIVTNAGGPGVMATDAAVSMGLEMARFESGTTRKLVASLPAAANTKNPVDVIGDARSDRYEAALAAVLDDENVDQALVILTPQSMTDIEQIARGIVKVYRNANKPIASSFMGASDVKVGIEILQAAHIPHYVLPEWACRAMADVQRVVNWQRTVPARFQPLPVDTARAEAVMRDMPAGYLREDQALAVLDAYGLPVPTNKLCTSCDEAVRFAEKIGYPVVLRVVSPQIVHKFDVKGVALDLANGEAVRLAYEEMLAGVAKLQPDAEVTGVIVRGMIPAGHELILGAKRDSVFGPTVMFGLGGVYVSVFKDVTFALAPVDEATAGRMIEGIKAIPLLKGVRGTQPADLAAVSQCLCRLGQLVTDFPRISELDINPLIAAAVGRGATVADVRIRLSE